MMSDQRKILFSDLEFMTNQQTSVTSALALNVIYMFYYLLDNTLFMC